MRWRLALLLPVALSLAFAPAPLTRRDDGKDDLKKLQGRWVRLSCTGGSIPPVPRPLTNDLVDITGDRIIYEIARGGPGLTWTLALGKGKAPRPFEIRRGADRWIGLYEIDGDTLRMCFTPNKERPASIQPTKVGEHLQTFRRQKR